MNFINFEGTKYKVIPYSKTSNFNNKLGLKRLESNLIFFVKCEKTKFCKFIEENELEFYYDNKKFDELYIKKFKFFEYIIYYKEGYLVLESQIKLRCISQIGDKYYGIDVNIFDFLKDISGCDEELGYATENDYPLPFRRKVTEKVCKFENCCINLPENEDYCGKHIILKSFKSWIYKRYLSEFEWKGKLEIFIY